MRTNLQQKRGKQAEDTVEILGERSVQDRLRNPSPASSSGDDNNDRRSAGGDNRRPHDDDRSREEENILDGRRGSPAAHLPRPGSEDRLWAEAVAEEERLYGGNSGGMWNNRPRDRDTGGDRMGGGGGWRDGGGIQNGGWNEERGEEDGGDVASGGGGGTADNIHRGGYFR